MTSTKALIKTRRTILSRYPSAVCKEVFRTCREGGAQSFDVLEDTTAFLDTETTGLSFKKCLIEISAAKLSGRVFRGRLFRLC